MSDDYGYTKMRAELAAVLGSSMATIESTWTDSVIRQMLIDGERSGSDVTATWLRENLLQVCARCKGKSHLRDGEVQAMAEALNAVYYIPETGFSMDNFGRRAGATQVHLETVNEIADQMGSVNIERCVAGELARSAS